jgi:hypothetical protein
MFVRLTAAGHGAAVVGDGAGDVLELNGGVVNSEAAQHAVDALRCVAAQRVRAGAEAYLNAAPSALGRYSPSPSKRAGCARR